VTSFSVDWLTLRAPADARARSAELIALAAEALAGVPEVHVYDLGAGTGATMRAVSPHLPLPQRWTFVDADAGLLEAARTWFTAADMPGVMLDCVVADLVVDPAPWEEPPSLVTASALFDLTSREVIRDLARRLSRGRVPLLAMLTYDGELAAEPAHPDDDTMRAAFNSHQRGIKTFGLACGPDGTKVVARQLEKRGYGVFRRPSPWVLEAGRDDALIAAMLDGWAAAAAELHPESAVPKRWLDARLARTDRLVVGHEDLLALPA
jgi:hypothetical protein